MWGMALAGAVFASVASAEDASRYLGSWGGVTLSYSDVTDDFIDPAFGGSPNLTEGSASGGVAGLGLIYGRNYSARDWIVGFDLLVEATNGRHENQSDGMFVSASFDAEYQAALRARAGRVLQNGMMIYGAAGVAAARFEFNYNFAGPPRDTFSDTVVGGTVALGIEGPLSSGLDFMSELSYTDFGTASGTITNCCAGPPNAQDHDLSQVTLRMGIIHRF